MRRPLLLLLLCLASLLPRFRKRTLGPAEGVLADDGVRLYVEEEGSGPLTVVFSHGFTAQLAEFALQRAALTGRARVVLYDQRGHGRSGVGSPRHATFDQLGRDLSAVLDQRVPTGPVVLFGHSMGGMTLMRYARQHPEAFGPRVVGVFLLATAADDVTAGGPVGVAAKLLRRLHLLPLYLLGLRLWSPVLERFRRRGTKAGTAFFRRYLFGRDDADPALVRQVQELLEQTPFTVTAAFYPSFLEHDEVASLAPMRAVPVTILVGDSDRLTPEKHSRLMARELPDAELVVVPGAGHSVNITRPEVVDRALLQLLDRAEAFAADRRAG
jgi:pimeloyl-ACP methyl ester carboxylesterase